MTSAPTITAPEESRTIPVMVALGDCATVAEARKNRLAMKRINAGLNILFLLRHADLNTRTRSTQGNRRLYHLSITSKRPETFSNVAGRNYGWFASTFKYAKRRGFPLGL